MSIRFRKSIKIAPGVKVNVSKGAVGMSVGTKGARVSVNSKGKVYRSVGIPGTGLYSVEQTSLKNNTPQNNVYVDENGEVFDESIQTVYGSPKEPLSHRTWFIILFLVIFFPVGLILMWKNSNWSKPTKIVISVIIGIMFIYALLTS